MKKLIFTILLAAVLWTVMFSPWTAPFVNFWWMMTGSALTLSVFATLFNPGWWREVKWSLPNVLLGIGIAVACGAFSGWETRCHLGCSILPVRRWTPFMG